MMIYIWLAAMGVIGFISGALFLYFFFRDKKLTRRYKISASHLTLNGALLLVSFSSFGLMIYFIISVKDQLISFGY